MYETGAQNQQQQEQKKREVKGFEKAVQKERPQALDQQSNLYEEFKDDNRGNTSYGRGQVIPAATGKKVSGPILQNQPKANP